MSKMIEQVAVGAYELSPPQFGQLSAGESTALVRLLGAYGCVRHARKPQKILAADTLEVSWTISSIAGEVLTQWPSGFHAFLGGLYRNAGSVESGRLTGAFGGFYRSLYSGLRSANLDWVRSEFEAFIASNWTGAMGRRNRLMPADFHGKLVWLSLPAAAKAAQLTKRSLLHLIEAGKVHATRRSTPSGREFLMVRRDDAEALVINNPSEVCLADAALQLGIKRQRLSRLLPTICPGARKVTLQGSPWKIPKSWVTGWQERIETLAIIVNVPASAISLDALLRYGPVDENRLTALLMDVDQNKLLPLGRISDLRGIAGLVFQRSDVLKQYSDTANTLMSIPQAANYLGVKQEVAYTLVKLGLLESHAGVVGRRIARGVSIMSLESFSRTYMLSSSISKEMRRSSRAIAQALAADGIFPVAGPQLGNCRQTVYRRTALATVDWLQVGLDPLNTSFR